MKSFNVSYMNWNEFKNVLIDPRKEEHKATWEFIRSQNVIIGGLDYTIDIE